MRPITKTLLGIGTHIIPLTTYGEVGVSYASDVATIVKPLANKDIVTSVIATISSSTSGNFLYPADALLVTTTANTVFTVIQYGD